MSGGALILLPLLQIEEGDRLLPLAIALARQHQATVLVLGLLVVPEWEPLSDSLLETRQLRATLDAVLENHESEGVDVRATVTVGHSAAEAIRVAAEDEGASLLLLGWQASSISSERLFGAPVEELLLDPPCDIAVARLSDPTRDRRILLPVRGGPHTELAYQTALALGNYHGASISVLYASDPRLPDDRVARAAVESLRHRPRVMRWLERTSSIEQAIAREAPEHQVIVLGITGRGDDPEGPAGPVANYVLRYTRADVILVSHRMNPAEQQAQRAWQQKYSINAIVDRWFARNTFSSREFDDLRRLAARKQEQGLTISLGLPTLNEEETIGDIILSTREALVEEVPLLDEIVLIDSGSDDRTREIARDYGIPVHVHQEVLPQYGSFAGKGEALWKSLYVLKGDLVAWVDTDIRNFHPRFVYGILGPLLREPRLVYSKGYYRRPIEEGLVLADEGGGRVTELVARPLLNLFYPELSGMVQPLSGEYAGRREALEQLTFFTGYGVEIALLIDLLQNYGLGAMAQVDLRQRVHRNQGLKPLSKMAFAIMQVVLQRLGERQQIQLLELANQSMKLIHNVSDEGFQLEVRQIRDHERPPMVVVPEYRERHQRVAAPLAAL
jgi:nucleotide-binding universal stress UspA family protein